jgi:hypothetical protein
MRKIIIALLIVMTSVAIFAQQRNYGSKKIGQWTLEKFPLHYFVIPKQTMTYKNQRTGKLEVYEQQNETGQTDGLTMIMSSDGIFPDLATYKYKGEIVYSASYFPSSNKVSRIESYNDKGEKDGYFIRRTLKSTGGYTESIEKWENDILVELNGVKQTPFELNFKDNLLDGKFKFKEDSYKIFEGYAENGKLKNIIQKGETSTNIVCEIIFEDDSIIIKKPSQSKNEYLIEKFPLISNPLLTNSKEKCLEYGNYNGYPYLYVGDYVYFDISNLEIITRQIYGTPLKTKVNYIDSLLDGDFQFREYIIYNGNYVISGYKTVTGKAEKGSLKFLRVHTIKFDPIDSIVSSDKTIEYTFLDSKIQINEFIPEVPNEPVSTSTLDYLYPVLLTNSVKLGGIFNYENTSTNNILDVPYIRKGYLVNNQYGYVYFSPTNFDASNFIKIVTTKTEKPFVEILNFENNFLDGEFDVKVGRVQFTGKANSGIIETLTIKFDFEKMELLNAPGNIMHGQTIKYDIILISLNGESYNIKYLNSIHNEKVFEQTFLFSKNKKVTISENLSGYENLVYCPKYQDLANTFLDMTFFVKK